MHSSVLKEEVYWYLEPKVRNKLLIDATLGEGGHSEIFLARSEDIRVVGLDVDPEILSVAKERLALFSGRVRTFNIWFNTFFSQYPLGTERPDKILFDLGISNFHYKRCPHPQNIM